MPDRPAYNPWLIAVAVSLATFMEVLDTSIANVALPHIAGSLSAGPDERTWVLTSYLVSNAVVIPISGWLSSVFGRKRFYMTCVALFTISSVACGLAPNLEMLLVFRVLQGIGGGGLAPSEQSILTDTFPPAKLGQAFALYAMAVVVAPAIGPSLGGWITDNYNWRWIFFINLPVGLLSLFLTYHLVQDSASAKAEHERERKRGFKVDYAGFFFTCLAFGSLQIVLDKGQEDDWLSSNFIRIFVLLTGVGLLGLIIWELFVAEEPIVDLPLIRHGNMGSSMFLMGMLGFILLGSTVLIPQFAQDLLHYDATTAGLLLLPGGIVLTVMAPVVGRLLGFIQPKYIMAVGAAIIGLAMFNLTRFTTDVSFNALAWARVYMCVGLPMFFVPVNTVAYTDLPPGKSNNASALINLMRNLGSSVGIAVATTMITRRAQFHQNRLVGNLTPTSYHYRHWLGTLARGAGGEAGGGASGSSGGLATGTTANAIVTGVPGGHGPGTSSLASLNQLVQQQAGMLSYIDVFKIMEWCCVVVFVVVLLTRKVKKGKAAAAH